MEVPNFGLPTSSGGASGEVPEASREPPGPTRPQSPDSPQSRRKIIPNARNRLQMAPHAPK
eukprot:5603137-Pyramimonas_sp.AAC.1